MPSIKIPLFTSGANTDPTKDILRRAQEAIKEREAKKNAIPPPPPPPEKPPKTVGRDLTGKVSLTSLNSKYYSGKIMDVLANHPIEVHRDKLKSAGITEAEKVIKPDFERFAQNYIKDEPKILFISEYIIDNKNCGALIVWEKYYDSTHYEIFKRNLFQSDSKFERILFLGSQDLEEERTHFIDYVKNTLGFSEIDENNIYIMLDEQIKEDRIYEYKVSATRVPKKANEIDYDMILESKGFLNRVSIDETSRATIFGFAGVNLGSKDLAWTISLVNENLKFFGLTSVQKPLADIMTPDIKEGSLLVYVPRDLDDILNIFNESMSIFNPKDVLSHFLDSLGGLPEEFKITFLNAIDEKRNTFSYDVFKDDIKTKVPVFGTLLDISKSAIEITEPTTAQQFSSLSLGIPSNSGMENLASISGLSKIFKFVNDTIIIILYAQEKEAILDKILDIIKTAKKDNETIDKDDLNDAIEEIRNDIEDGSLVVDDEEADLFGVSVGKKIDTKDIKSVRSGKSLKPGFRII